MGCSKSGVHNLLSESFSILSKENVCHGSIPKMFAGNLQYGEKNTCYYLNVLLQFSGRKAKEEKLYIDDIPKYDLFWKSCVLKNKLLIKFAQEP